MADEVISFFDCAAPLQKERSITVSSDRSDWSNLPDRSDGVKTIAGYTIVVPVLRRFTRWITVTAERFRRAVVRTFRARFRNIVRNTGVQILRQSAILRI